MSRRRRALWGVLAAAWLPLLCGGLWAFAPYADGSWVVCAFRRATGVPCPGCGMTRSVGWLVRGDVLESLRSHPLGGLALALLAAAWVYGLGVVCRRWRLSVWVAVGIAIAFGTLVIAVWLFRLSAWTRDGTLPPEFHTVGIQREVSQRSNRTYPSFYVSSTNRNAGRPQMHWRQLNGVRTLKPPPP